MRTIIYAFIIVFFIYCCLTLPTLRVEGAPVTPTPHERTTDKLPPKEFRP